MNPITKQFHIQQVRLRSKGGKAKAVRGGQAAHPVFFSATGDSSYYEIPAIYRKRVRQLALDNAARLAQYSKRNRAYVDGEAA